MEIIQLPQIDYLETSTITLSGLNPRKNFKETEIQELSESIKSVGVLQPILVRIVDDVPQLVCGERRLRASKIAGITQIPAFIRELTDAEAFECMIIENLERKDVHPLEESDSFQRMLDSGNYSLDDVAAKVAKPVKYVLQRLKLNNLIEAIKEDFFNDLLPMGHANVIARLEHDVQNDIHSDYVDSWYASDDGYGSLKELNSYIEDFMYVLDPETFSLELENLLPGVSACTGCLKRTGANPLLFTDLEGPDKCLDRTCFNDKESAFKEYKIKELVESGADIYFIDWGCTVEENLIDLLKGLEVPILKEHRDYNYTEVAGVEPKKGIQLAGRNFLSEIKIWLKSESLVVDENGKSTISAAPINPNQEQIKKIKDRAIRGLELDQEKIQVAISQSFSTKLEAEYLEKYDVDVDFTNTIMFFFAVSKAGGWNFARQLSKILPDDKFSDFKTYEDMQTAYLSLTDIEKMQVMVALVFNQCQSSMPKYFDAQLLRKAYSYLPENDMAEIIAAQKVKADARIKREQERILALEPAPVVEEITSDIPSTYKKVTKKYALNNSYFKNCAKGSPATVLEIAQYLNEHHELPFDYSGNNWVYDAYIKYQKINNVYHSQYFTPDATAERMTELGVEYFNESLPVLDACCGFGQLSKGLANLGFTIEAFDLSSDLVDLYNLLYSPKIVAQRFAINEYNGSFSNIISNPPYEVPELTTFFEMLTNTLTPQGRAVVLIPKDFMDKQKPKKLYEVLKGFTILHQEDMTEEFAHTKWKSEIVILEKN